MYARCLAVLLAVSLPVACADLQPVAADPAQAVGQVLDDFHAAASRADGEAYFGCFAADGVFLGTDASERWTLEEFRAYAEPYFSEGQGWTYHPRNRHVMLSSYGHYAWFDELLDNDKYGEVRGTGVLRREVGQWKLVHYSMTFLIPNDRSTDVVDIIRSQ